MKIVLAGSPRTGKSCLREHLKRAIVTLAPSGPYPYIITANPDGEGSWYQEAASRDKDAAHENRARNKAPFSTDFARRVARNVRDCRQELVLVDIGGMISDENRQICRSASHIVILHTDASDLAAWRRFAGELDLEIIAELRSVYAAESDHIGSAGPPLVGVVHRLERGERDVPHPIIDVLASTIVSPSNLARDTMQRPPAERTYRIERRGPIIQVGTGRPGPGNELVTDAMAILDELEGRGALRGGGIIGVNGVITVAVSGALVHRLAQRFAAVALFDAPSGAYTVVVSRDSRWRVGDVLREAALPLCQP